MQDCSAIAGSTDGIPPHGVREMNLKPRVSSNFGGLDQTEVALCYQVREAESLILILFGDGNHETQVGFGQLFEGFLISFS